MVSAFTAFKVKIMNTEQIQEKPNNLENINQDEPMIDDVKSDDLQRVLAKNSELLGKLKKAKEDNAASIAQIEQMQADHQNELESVKGGYEQEIERLRQVEADFENYRVTEYKKAVLQKWLDVFPEHEDFIQFQLDRLGYKIIYADNQELLMKENREVEGKLTEVIVTKQVTGYCFIDPEGMLVTQAGIDALRTQFGSYCKAHYGQGSGALGSPSRSGRTQVVFNRLSGVNTDERIKELHFGLK